MYLRPVSGYADHGISPAQLAELRAAAQGARTTNYSRYSDFMVLAAVETSQGLFGGSNVENVNYTLTKHAEEVAILAAILAGAGPQGAWIETLYVTSASPCGSCRQFTAEFARPQTVVLIDRIDQGDVRSASLPDLSDDSVEAWLLGDLLPAAFEPSDIDRTTET
jgi:homotetrameric cytidine deaminase